MIGQSSGLRSHFSEGLSARRRFADFTVTAFALLSTVAVLAPLIAIIGYIVWNGLAALNLAFFTHDPAPVGELGGGMANAILGSGVLLLLAIGLGVPAGIAGGIYLAEYSRGRALRHAVRFTADVLNGVPSIVIGIVVYAWVVAHMEHFSAFAGGLALAIIMVPSIARTTEEMLLAVPQSLREAAWGLGVAHWRTIVSVSLRSALPGILTGCMLAFARVAGETAPLLFTAFGNQYRSAQINQPIAALPLQIYVYGTSPYDEWHRLAWAGALVLVLLIVASVALVRIFSKRGLPMEAR